MSKNMLIKKNLYLLKFFDKFQNICTAYFRISFLYKFINFSMVNENKNFAWAKISMRDMKIISELILSSQLWG